MSIRECGYALVESGGYAGDPLIAVARLLGPRQLHARADRDGITGNDSEGLDTTWRSYRSEYRGIGNDEFELHTDGSFLHGPDVNPPIALLLHCVQSASDGGVNLLVDGTRLYRDVAQQDANLLARLRARQFTYCRDDMIAVDQPVFADRGSGRVSLRWRYDRAVYGRTEALEALHTFHRDYVASKRADAEILLTPGQILVIDNIRMLHARTSASGPRKMRRIWIGDPASWEVWNLDDRTDVPRALAPFQHYAMVDNRRSGALLCEVTGIVP
jgi:alpha-ketoglutarate-dependent taurine dioxygenase